MIGDSRMPIKPKYRKLYCSLTYDGIGGYPDICCINSDPKRIGMNDLKKPSCVCSYNPDKYVVFVMTRAPKGKK